MTDDVPQDGTILISARLSPAEAADQKARILGQISPARPLVVEMIEAEDCRFPTAVSLQLCLAAAAELRAAGHPPSFGPEAQRLLGAQALS